MKKFIPAVILLLPVIASAQQQNQMKDTGRVGIATTAPRVLFDVGLPATNTTTSVLGRLPEGNGATTDIVGTYLGIQTYNTTPAPGKSFAIEHKFYSTLNSSISFYRGGSTVGGFMTFSTYNNIERMRIDGSGNVGIGSIAPTDRLTIDNGNTRNGINIVSDGDASVYSDFKFTIKTPDSLATGKPFVWLASCRKDGYFTGDITGPTLEFYAVKKGGSYIAPLLFKSNGDVILAGAKNAISGNVGIGTLDTKGYKLAVAGGIIAEKVTVKLQSNWPDFVFEKDYHLPSLSEVEKEITVNKHLSGVPSASNVSKDGIDVGEMNRILLQKVEELTLYIIDLQKQIDQMKAIHQ